ncbi:hypothetical protein C1645_812455 [Glomus cerebriforme]|uniref:Uncharacterized protein n=1 Tax=Glomus cerebriforme TaxID=658196 RepID=A0A397TKZ4_9GLOM|nr:hypothetical protein C1645_812455 [Glomus cerebriforme]
MHKKKVVKKSIPKKSSAESEMFCESSGNKQSTLCHDSTLIPKSISSKHISDIPVNANPTPSSVPHLAHLFDKAKKTD